MRHSEILKAVENAIESPSVEILNITCVDTHIVPDEGFEVRPGTTLKAGKYGIVELRVALPINQFL